MPNRSKTDALLDARDQFVVKWERLDKDLQQDVLAGVIGGAAALTALVGAVRSLRKGEVDKAIFKLMLWQGINANNNAGFAHRQAKRADKHLRAHLHAGYNTLRK